MASLTRDAPKALPPHIEIDSSPSPTVPRLEMDEDPPLTGPCISVMLRKPDGYRRMTARVAVEGEDPEDSELDIEFLSDDEVEELCSKLKCELLLQIDLPPDVPGETRFIGRHPIICISTDSVVDAILSGVAAWIVDESGENPPEI